MFKRMISGLLMLFMPLMGHQDDYTFKLVVGDDLKGMFPFFAEQRIGLFREYPYLYEGDL